ncbi:hypothetical protein J6590_009851 [Homalodisca vitripennis]|nr:hypothetical protein J6590_009851 [Homalodisca vitripennis]
MLCPYNKFKTAWITVNRETGRYRPSHHVQPNAEDFSKYCISAFDEIRQSLSLPSSSAVDLLQFSTSAPSQLFNWRPVTDSEGVINAIAYPLDICINACLLEGNFTSKFKMSKVVPVFKKGNYGELNSYRAISLVSSFSKKEQFGCICGMSMIDAVEGLVSNILFKCELGSPTDATYVMFLERSTALTEVFC